MIAVIKLILDAPVRFAPWFAAILLAAGWFELASGTTLPFLGWPALICGALYMPRSRGVLNDMQSGELEPTLSELILASACVVTLILALVTGWVQQSSGIFMYAFIAIGLLMIRMVLRKRGQFPAIDSFPE